MKTLDDITGAYGQNWTTGVLAEHLHLTTDTLTHVAPSGKTYVTGPKGGSALPVLCGEIVEIWTEDGPISGRCGSPTYNNEFACPSHYNSIFYRDDLIEDPRYL